MTESIDPASITKNQLFLYTDNGFDSHVIRFLLAEKQLTYRHSYLASERPEDIADINPYRTLPILIHSDIILYEINIIFEYIEERYHTNKLLPESPQRRAQVRQLAWRIQNDWLSLARNLLMHPDSYNANQAAIARKELTDSLVTLSPIFTHKNFFMSDNIGWCDILLTPLLWHLQEIDLKLPKHLVRPLISYQDSMFKRKAFQESLVKGS